MKVATTPTPVDPSRLAMHRRRKLVNAVALTLSLIAMAFGLFWLIWILIETARLGLGGLSMAIFTEMTPPPPPTEDAGGLANSIFGSFVMVALATLVGTPIGVMAGIYLAEYGQKNWLARATRFVNDILLSAPSIVIGLFIFTVVVLPMKSSSGIAGVMALALIVMAGIYLAEYGQKNWLARATRFVNDILLSAPSIVIGLFIFTVVVLPMKSSSGIAGVMALALIVIPVVLRTTENMLALVPNGLREAAYALGAPKWKVILSITLKAARAGVITGVLLALARIAGETAPLLYTAASNQFWATDIWRSMDSLPVRIFKFAMSPYDTWQQLAWAGVFLITLGVLVLNIVARAFFRNKQ